MFSLRSFLIFINAEKEEEETELILGEGVSKMIEKVETFCIQLTFSTSNLYYYLVFRNSNFCSNVLIFCKYTSFYSLSFEYRSTRMLSEIRNEKCRTQVNDETRSHLLLCLFLSVILGYSSTYQFARQNFSNPKLPMLSD